MRSLAPESLLTIIFKTFGYQLFGRKKRTSDKQCTSINQPCDRQKKARRHLPRSRDCAQEGYRIPPPHSASRQPTRSRNNSLVDLSIEADQGISIVWFNLGVHTQIVRPTESSLFLVLKDEVLETTSNGRVTCSPRACH